MKSSLDHLPDRKQRELAYVVETLREGFAQVIGRKRSDRAKSRQILKIILFGSYARGDWVEDPVGRYFSDYDILVVVNSERATDGAEYWAKTERKLLADISEGTRLRPESGRRAWRITGDYGVGKSSFALVVAHLMARNGGKGLDRIAADLGWDMGGALPALWPVLLTGSRSSMVAALATAVAAAVEAKRPARGKTPRAQTAMIERARSIAASGNALELEALLVDFRALAAESGAGVLLIVDELGKFLEHAAQGDGEDVFILQRVAEMAARSGKRPFVVLGLLHQGFHAYADRLPMASRNEWEKVAGRFEEIVFDQPLAHMAALVAGALRLDPAALPAPVRDVARQIASATAQTGWLGGGTVGAVGLDVARLYPLHPTVLPVRQWGAGKVEVFESKPMELQAGDRVQFTRNDREEGRINGLRGTVTDIDPERQQATIALTNGREQRLDLTDPRDAHLRHAYVQTAHAAQGQTAERVLIHADSRSANLVDQKMLYVALSRAKSEAIVVTDDKPRLIRAIHERAGEKQTAMEVSALEAAKTKSLGAGLG
ncbi:MAG: hypothetical protein B7Z34_12395 [Novosphingobium sp. 12-62-10]|nr:MAG: hypothetical protein B7Z34_12395 [Novosphingobium sp. 12-62-10]